MSKRDDILDRAVAIASVDGLEGLTIGRLASELSMSKSGLFGHFGSKEELQLAAVERAGQIFEARVMGPSSTEPPGLGRARAIASAWLGYLADGFDGGCFFHAASLEFDGRPGRVRDEIRRLTGRWYVMLEDQLRRAAIARELPGDPDPSLVAFQVHALLGEANWAYRLFGRTEALDRARSLIDSVLGGEIVTSERRSA